MTGASSALSPDLVAHGASVGVDVAALKSKYLMKKVQQVVPETDENSIKAAQQIEDADRLREREAAYDEKHGLKTAASMPDPRATDIKKANAKLDRLVLCSRCQGQGMYKKRYNFQERDVNCEVCDGEGIMYRSDGGSLVFRSEMPAAVKGEKTMSEEQAMELAKNCGGRRIDEEDPSAIKAGDFDMPPMFT